MATRGNSAKRHRIAAIFAHPDDEVLGCGASLALHADRGDQVRILLLATGLAARAKPSAAALKTLRTQAQAAAEVLGATSVDFADFPDNAMDSVPLLAVVKQVEQFLGRHGADVIYTHHAGDLNVDHRVTHQAVVTATRPTPGAGDIEILASEVNSSTEWATPPLAPFVPTDFVDVAATLQRKIDALSCYASEVRGWPHPRSADGVRALGRWRGTSCGCEAAEAFSLVRRIRHVGAKD